MQLVHIEFRQIQRFIFAVPRLRCMVGANVRLGEFTRKVLPGLAKEAGSLDVSGHDAAAAAHWSESARFLALDPLGREDDPCKLLPLGVLARDGGHFEAVFPSASAAQRFAESVGSQNLGTLC